MQWEGDTRRPLPMGHIPHAGRTVSPSVQGPTAARATRDAQSVPLTLPLALPSAQSVPLVLPSAQSVPLILPSAQSVPLALHSAQSVHLSLHSGRWVQDGAGRHSSSEALQP